LKNESVAIFFLWRTKTLVSKNLIFYKAFTISSEG
jgi:hypothetical protein